MATKMFLVRHGLTDWNQQKKYQGQKDIPLNEKGCEQARSLGKYLKAEEIDSIYSSDLKRALQTANIINENHDLEVNKKEKIREIHFGDWQGLSYSEIEEQYPQRLKKWNKDPITNCPPGGETMAVFIKRVKSGFEEIINKNQDNNILVVSHGGTIKVYLTILLEMPPKNHWQFDISSTGLSVINFYEDNKAIISAINVKKHLDELKELKSYRR